MTTKTKMMMFRMMVRTLVEGYDTVQNGSDIFFYQSLAYLNSELCLRKSFVCGLYCWYILTCLNDGINKC
jgi:hypothetical protein